MRLLALGLLLWLLFGPPSDVSDVFTVRTPTHSGATGRVPKFGTCQYMCTKEPLLFLIAFYGVNLGYCPGTCVGIIHVVYESSGLACLNLRGEPCVLDVSLTLISVR